MPEWRDIIRQFISFIHSEDDTFVPFPQGFLVRAVRDVRPNGSIRCVFGFGAPEESTLVGSWSVSDLDPYTGAPHGAVCTNLTAMPYGQMVVECKLESRRWMIVRATLVVPKRPLVSDHDVAVLSEEFTTIISHRSFASLLSLASGLGDQV
jgi:hypothetical protein